MEITVKRFADDGDTTMSCIFIDGVFQTFGIEDEERDVKVKGETRVPEGTYKVALRAEGGFHNRYKSKFSDIHKGMLAIYNQKNWVLENKGMSFQYVLIHVGNTDDHTAGCLLLNDVADAENFRGSRSAAAYKKFYPKVRDAILNGENVTITYVDIETGK